MPFADASRYRCNNQLCSRYGDLEEPVTHAAPQQLRACVACLNLSVFDGHQWGELRLMDLGDRERQLLVLAHAQLTARVQELRRATVQQVRDFDLFANRIIST